MHDEPEQFVDEVQIVVTRSLVVIESISDSLDATERQVPVSTVILDVEVPLHPPGG